MKLHLSQVHDKQGGRCAPVVSLMLVSFHYLSPPAP